MPYDAQGVFTRLHNWQDDAANDISILASRHDQEDDNFANGFNDVLCRDGRAAMTGNLKMGGSKITGLANGTNANDAVNKSQLDGVSSSVSTLDSAVVKLTGNQTVAGTKTFNSSPVVPTPSTSDNSTKAASTAFVNNKVAKRVGNWGTMSTITALTSTSSTYTMTNDGFIAPRIRIQRLQTVGFLVNGKEIISYKSYQGDASDDYEIQFSPFPVAKGDVLKYTSTDSSSKVVNVKFWAYRG